METGILALQGDFERHLLMMKKLDCSCRLVRSAEDIKKIDALIIPGGESTTMGRLINSFSLSDILEQRINQEHMPVFGTCAGLILLARRIQGYQQYCLKALDISVTRNAYGRQTESFETNLEIAFPDSDHQNIRGIFIRAPRITECGKDVEILASYEDSPVLIRQKSILAASFHPELADDTRIHRFFWETAKDVLHNKP